MDPSTLSERLHVVDGFIPRTAIINAMNEGQAARIAARQWQRISIVLLLVALVSVGLSLVLYTRMAQMAGELAAYDKSFVTKDDAAMVSALSIVLAKTNQDCLAMHKQNQDFYKALMATMPEPQHSGSSPVTPVKQDLHASLFTTYGQ